MHDNSAAQPVNISESHVAAATTVPLAPLAGKQGLHTTTDSD